MSRPPLGFRRLVLGLPAGAPAPATQLAVEFAELFGAELLGLFIENAALRRLAAMPFAREITALGGGWRPIEPARMARELDLAAGAAERLFAATAGRLARRQFEIVHGHIGEAIARLAQADDLLVIGAPAPSERAAEPFVSLLRAAFASRAGVMLAPSRRARRAGPVIAVATRPDDPSIGVAAAIAEAIGEDLIVVDLAGPLSEPATLTRRDEEPQPRATRRIAAAGQSLPQVLHGFRERLAVATRATFGAEMALAIAAARGVPVLSVETAGDEREADD